MKPTAKLIIPRSVLDSCLQGARESHPAEFVALLSGEARGETVVAEKVYLPPLAHADIYSTSFDAWNVPIALGVVASFHSHPNGVALPSRQDLRFFPKAGVAHLIAGAPYGRVDAAAFDNKGKRIEMQVT